MTQRCSIATGYRLALQHEQGMYNTNLAMIWWQHESHAHTAAWPHLLGLSMYSLLPWKTQYWASICLQVELLAQAPSSMHSQLGVAMSRMWVSARRLWLPVLLVLMPDEMSRNLLRMHAAWPSRPTGEFPATVT